MTFLRSADNYGGQKPSHDIAVPVAISGESQGIPATGGSERDCTGWPMAVMRSSEHSPLGADELG